ncbi:phage portal protein [Corynebacterium sp. TAE3-ERU16]|uniref:phage portal protein n=1 Tax=Corynebacterium sp. TAE3-ERU16 TaxID=2849493 RepID=UPI001C4478ED|nr:phage portal protein [Corynebacterium sp. TAE3-ERU16]MBV7292366.1 phage portal protein [Corynebacterium sp. TAE3-ERU16]
MPAQHTEWPPAPIRAALDQVKQDSAWLTGDTRELSRIVESHEPAPVQIPLQYNGGIAGAAARGILGRPAPRTGNATIPKHLPLPHELAVESANILVGTPPAITVHAEEKSADGEDRTPAEDALAALTSTDRFASDLHRAATYCAGLGWTFGRIVWNLDVQPSPWIEWVDADQGWVEWANSRPVAITFWDVYPDPDGKHQAVWRLLQRHSRGRITYGLYQGDSGNLGRLVPVTDHPDTAYLADILDEEASITTGIDRLTAVMIPNVDGNPAWRKHPQLRNLGLSDVSRGGDLWATIDKFWTELSHEVDIARGRLLVSEEYLDNLGAGNGLGFNWNRDVFTLAQSGSPNAEGRVEMVQFQLRVAEYSAALDRAQREVFDAVGLSEFTVGHDTSGGTATTATEITARSAKTLKTWKAKARMWRAGLSDLLTAWSALDGVLNDYQGAEKPVDVAMFYPVEDTELDKARTVAAYRDAGAASTEYAVDRMHPEWTQEQKDEEVARIKAEQGIQVDPLLTGIDQHPFRAIDG